MNIELKAVQEWSLIISKGKSVLGRGKWKYRYSRESMANCVYSGVEKWGECKEMNQGSEWKVDTYKASKW